MSPNSGSILQEEVVPRLRSAIPTAVKYVGCEDAQELIQDATAMAAKMMHNVELAGKKVTPGNIAYYTIQHMKSGRRSTGSSVVDILGTGTQLKGHTRMNSLEDVVASDAETGGEIFTLNDILSNDQEDPSTKAARKMDWEAFCAGLSERERMVVEFMVQGESMNKAAHALRVDQSTIKHSKRRLRAKILEFMGADILIEVRHKPQWKDNLDATRERMECRDERRHL